MITPGLYVLILFKLALLATLSAIVGIGSWKIMCWTKKKVLSRLVGYYIVTMLVIFWFLGLGWIIILR